MRIKKIRGKKGDMAVDKIIVIVLIILVITLVIFLIFRADITKWFRNLPYSYDEQNKDKEVGGKDTKVPNQICPEGSIKIGYIGNYEEKFGPKEQFIYLGNKRTDLTWHDDAIELEGSGVIEDYNVAAVVSGKIGIYTKWYQQEAHKKYKNLPSTEELAILDGAYKVAGNILCKKEVKK